MSTLHRIVAVGLPTAGLTVFTALALGGSPAIAGPADQLGRPAAVTTPCAEADQTKCGYGNTAPDDTDNPDTTTPDDSDTAPDTDTPTRGGSGYGTPSPTTTSPTPTASTDTVPPGVSPSSATPSVAAATTPGGGVSAGHALPVTGAPMGTIVSLGALLVAAGGASVFYTRRRRSA